MHSGVGRPRGAFIPKHVARLAEPWLLNRLDCPPEHVWHFKHGVPGRDGRVLREVCARRGGLAHLAGFRWGQALPSLVPGSSFFPT